MRNLIVFLFISFSTLSFSKEYNSSIYDIDHGSSSEEKILLLLNDGMVLKVDHDHRYLLDEIDHKNLSGKTYSFVTDEDRNVLSITSGKDSSDQYFNEVKSVSATYVPTTVASIDVLKKYFNEAPYNPKESQCFNRAMVWSYGWWKKHSLKSMKIYIFFTRNYIRRYNFEWWFHISPYAHVLEGGKVVERVLDRKYSRGPLPFKGWTDLFMRNDADCRVITKFSEYADFPYTGECYTYRANMFSYQPADLQMNEAWGYTKDSFNMDEVKGAYLEAFDIKL